MINIKNEKITRIIEYLVFAVYASLFVLRYSVTTSPFGTAASNDSMIFMHIGRLWSKGQIPYVDCFDHKGPIIFLIDALGFKLTGDKTGICIIQMFFMYATLYGFYKIFQLKFEKTRSLLLTIAAGVMITFSYECGNMTEEYCLSFLVWSLYFALKYIDNREYKHPAKYAFFYGITFMVAVLTRMTNAAPICIITFVILMYLIIKKEWSNIFVNASVFIIGAALTLLPFLVYFGYYHAIYDMVYGTIIYNIRYAADEGGQLSILKTMWSVKGSLMPVLFTSVVTAIYLVQKKKIDRLSSIGILMCIGCGFMTIINLPYSHYNLIWTLIFGLGIYFCKELEHNKGSKIILTLVVVFISVFTVTNNVYFMVKSKNKVSVNEQQEYGNMIQEVLDRIDTEKNIIGYNIGTYFYLYSDIVPCYKYSFLQDWQMEKDKEMRDEFIKQLKSLKADYVIESVNGGNLDYIIEKYYVEEFRTKKMKVMVKK